MLSAHQDAVPLLSVVTVSLNAAATIGDTLASVAKQSANFAVEHICVDGGSTDGTREIIDEWASRSQQVRRIYERDKGIFDAMNKGWTAAAGEYVLYLNADDFFVSPDVIRVALAGVATGTERPDLIVGDVVMGELNRSGVWRHRRVPRALGRWRRSGLFPVHQGVFAKRRLLEAVGGFDATLKLGSDVTLFYDLERRFPLSIRRMPMDIAFMRGGGAANASAKAVRTGSIEIYRHLAKTHSRMRSAAMVMVKTAQSLSELRVGRCPYDRWFADRAATVTNE